jgi:membrane-bound lytic murein transglycosylase B
MLVPLTVVDGMEYRVGFANFYAITRYNRSTMYASAVSDLAAAIGARRSGLPLPEVAAPTVPTAPTAPAVAPASTGGWSTTTGGR